MELHFYKYQALLNDYILIENPEMLNPELIKTLCNRRSGIGADGILGVTTTSGLDMRIYNSDGSEALMCGNGLRCTIYHLFRRNIMPLNKTIDLMTASGVRGGRIISEIDENSAVVEGYLEKPILSGSITRHNRDFTIVNTGNPHCITFVEENEDIKELALALGPDIETSVEGGINVSFARVSGDEIHLAVWERGAGFTMACGTGAVATSFAARSKELIFVDRIKVVQAGGSAIVTHGNITLLEGSAHCVFEGTIKL